MYRIYRYAEWKWTEWGLGNSWMGQEVEGISRDFVMTVKADG